MHSSTRKEISCRITRTLLMYVREANNGSLGTLLDDWIWMKHTSRTQGKGYSNNIFTRSLTPILPPNKRGAGWA